MELGKLKFHLDELLDEVYRAVDAQYRRVDTEVVGSGGSPCVVAVIIIIGRTFLVGFFHHFFRFVFADVQPLGQPFDACLGRSRYEDVGTSRMVAKYIVGTASDEEARLFFGKVADDIALYLEQRIIAQVRIVGLGSFGDEREPCAEQASQQAL